MKKNIIRKFGFYKDQDGIVNRYLREAGGWDSHLNKTKQFILNASLNKPRNKACILGTGWLLDIPYHELSETFEELVFIDIKHPRQVEHKLRNYKNIKLVEDDISGLIEPVYHAIRSMKKNNFFEALYTIKPIYSNVFSEILETADFIVSVNLLNQLDILICDYLIKTKLFSDDQIINFRKYIQNKHIELLPKNKSALITDYEEYNLDGQKQIVNRKNLVYIKFPQNIPCERWTWDFDLRKTYHTGLQTIFKVMAFEV
jgi:hypothetical protein